MMMPTAAAGNSGAALFKKTISFTLLLLSFCVANAAPEPDWGFCVQLSAVVQDSPPQITLNWEPDPLGATNYVVYRKSKNSTSWGSPIATFGGDALTFTDSNVAVGTTYEYQVVKSRFEGSLAYGYIYTGIEAPMIDSRGTLVLLVATNSTVGLNAELGQLQSDLVGDGWQVIRHDVSSNDTPAHCRSLVIADYNANPGSVTAVLLFGHVPVLQSGMVNYDGHGARPMPSDGFYGDMNGDWSSSPSFLPSDVELMVGRVDLADMPGAAAPGTWPSETELLRNYLHKDHNWRFKQIQVPRKALIADRFGTFEGETRASAGYRNFEPFIGPGNIQLADVSDTASPDQRWISLLTTGTYLWTYGNGGGQDTSISELGLHGQYNDVWSTDLRSQDAHAVFFMLEGSHFGNWDHSDDVMRAVLATPTMGLTVCCIAGRPEWYCHHVGLGEPIGYGARLTMNNSTMYKDTTNEYARAVYVALMGDPTLRIDQVAPPSNLRASVNNGTVSLSWFGSSDSVAGYHVYRGASTNGPFVRLTSSPVGTSFDDTSAPTGDVTYMVRAVALQVNPSGSYYNPSQGIFTTVNVSTNSDNGGGDTNVVSVTPGTYNGLFYESDQVRQSSSGAFSVTVTSKGAYSGHLQMSGKRDSFTGKLSDSGQITNSVKGAEKIPLTVQLNFTPSNADQVSGTVSDGTWTANLIGERATFDKRTNAFTGAGSYTMVIQGATDDPALPAGNSYATITVAANGQVNAAITLADDTKVTQSATISADGVWPLYAAPYSGKGSILGWVTFADDGQNDLAGSLTWSKPTVAHAKYYPAGFGFQTAAIGSHYQPPAKGGTLITLNNGTVNFSGGNLAEDVFAQITIGNNNQVSETTTNGLKMSFAPGSGRFTGTLKDPSGARKTLSFSGAVLQRQSSGGGFLLGTNQTTRVDLN